MTTLAFAVIRHRDGKRVAMFTDVVMAHRCAEQKRRTFCETFYVRSAVVVRGAQS